MEVGLVRSAFVGGGRQREKDLGLWSCRMQGWRCVHRGRKGEREKPENKVFSANWCGLYKLKFHTRAVLRVLASFAIA